MKAIEFIEQNTVFAKDQPQYNPLPAHVSGRPDQAVVTSCWEISEAEMQEAILNFARHRQLPKIYVSQVTFGHLLQPVCVQTSFNPPKI